MTRFSPGLTAAALLAGMVFSSSPASAQQSLKSQMVGAWTLVSSNQTDKDGKNQDIFGANPRGILVLDASGQYVQIITRSDTPKFAVNNRLRGTPEENTVALRGVTANFGTWTVDEAKKIVTVRYVGAAFPNQAGTEAARIVSVAGDELSATNPTTSAGVTSKTVWRRAK